MAAHHTLQACTTGVVNLGAIIQASNDLGSAQCKLLMQSAAALWDGCKRSPRQATRVCFGRDERAFAEAVLTALQAVAEERHVRDRYWLAAQSALLAAWDCITTVCYLNPSAQQQLDAWTERQGEELMRHVSAAPRAPHDLHPASHPKAAPVALPAVDPQASRPCPPSRDWWRAPTQWQRPPPSPPCWGRQQAAWQTRPTC